MLEHFVVFFIAAFLVYRGLPATVESIRNVITRLRSVDFVHGFGVENDHVAGVTIGGVFDED